MKRGMVVFAVVVVVLTWGLGALMLASQGALGQFAGLVMVPALLIPFVMAYVAHRLSGAQGNPFAGLRWGNTSWYFLAWLGGLAVAAVTLVICIGLGLNRLDPEMASYVKMVKEQSEANGQSMPAEAESFLKVGGYITAFAVPTIGAWFGAAIGCLMTLPWLGWFFRRTMVFGRSNSIIILMVLFLLTGITGGLAENPMWGDAPIWQRMLLTGLASLAYVPALIWVFLRTRSAVIPALAMYSFQNGLSGATPFLSIEAPLFAPPFGVAGSLLALAAGIGLWVWKDPGGADLAVAAVAHDGTPLTPEQAAALDEDDFAAPPEPEVRAGLVPPPPTPGEILGLPPDSEPQDQEEDDQGGAGGQ